MLLPIVIIILIVALIAWRTFKRRYATQRIEIDEQTPTLLWRYPKLQGRIGRVFHRADNELCVCCWVDEPAFCCSNESSGNTVTRFRIALQPSLRVMRALKTASPVFWPTSVTRTIAAFVAQDVELGYPSIDFVPWSKDVKAVGIDGTYVTSSCCSRHDDDRTHIYSLEYIPRQRGVPVKILSRRMQSTRVYQTGDSDYPLAFFELDANVGDPAHVRLVRDSDQTVLYNSALENPLTLNLDAMKRNIDRDSNTLNEFQTRTRTFYSGSQADFETCWKWIHTGFERIRAIVRSTDNDGTVREWHVPNKPWGFLRGIIPFKNQPDLLLYTDEASHRLLLLRQTDQPF
jgi:hypothetical protein